MISKNNKYLFIILCLFFIKSLFWLFAFPVFQTPDENRHYDYIIHLAKKHKLPLGETAIIGRATYMEETLFLQKVTDFNVIHFKTKKKTQPIFHADSLWQKIAAYKENDTVSDVTDPENISINYYPPLFYLLEAGVYQIAKFLGGNLIIRFYALRLFQVLISLITIILMWHILEQLGFSLNFRVAYLLIFTFWPQLSMFTIGLQPDVLGMLLVTLIIYIFILNIKKNVRYFYLALGILLGFLMLVKLHYATVMVSSIIIFHSISYWLNTKRIDFKLAQSAIVALIIAAPWLYHNITHYNVLLPHAVVDKAIEPTLPKQILLIITAGRAFTFPSFIGYFGWMDTKLPDCIYDIYYVLILISAISFSYFSLQHFLHVARLTIKKQKGLLSDALEKNLPFYVIFGSFFFFFALMMYISFTISPWLVDQGRHYFPFIFALLLIFVRYSHKAFKFLKAENIYLVVLVIFVFLSNILSYIIIWNRYYMT